MLLSIQTETGGFKHFREANKKNYIRERGKNNRRCVQDLFKIKRRKQNIKEKKKLIKTQHFVADVFIEGLL